MDNENKLAHDIRSVLDDDESRAEKLKADNMCKKILSHRIILAHILKYCIDEYKSYTPKEIAENFIEGEPDISGVPVNRDEIVGMNTEDSSLDEETVRYDILFYSLLPTTRETVKVIINIEVQNKYNAGYPLLKRAIYYCSRMMSAQYGKEFSKSHYGDIKKVYSVWICPDAPKKRHNTVNKYRITEENLLGSAKDDVENYDLLNVFVICLGNEDEENYADIIELLSALTTFKKKYPEIKDMLENKFEIELSEEMDMEVRNMCNISTGIEERGINKGLEQGKNLTLINSVKGIMSNLKLSAEEALAVINVPVEDRGKYLKMLEEAE
jgi:hypothetical protein